MKKILLALVLGLQLIAAHAQTYKVQNLVVLGTATLNGPTTLSMAAPSFSINDSGAGDFGNFTFSSNNVPEWTLQKSSAQNLVFERYVGGTYVDNPLVFTQSNGQATFSVRPVFGTNTPWDSGNFTPGSYATLAGNQTFSGTNTFSGAVNLNGTNSIAGYLTSATAASTYLPISNPSATGTMTAGTFSGAGTSLTGTAASLSIGGTAAKATNVAGGASNQIVYQTAANTSGFIAAPTSSGTCLNWNGTALNWAACSASSGTVSSVAASGGSTGLTFTGSPITTSGTLTLGGLLGVGYGGTGATTLTANAVMVGNGTSAVQFATTGTQGRVLMDAGAGVPPKFASPGPYILFGADPTGSVDATSIIQAAVNTVVAAGGELVIPPGTYKISNYIDIPFGAGWKIHGSGRVGTVINQTASNTPIWRFATGTGGTGPYDWAITDLTLHYNTAQASTNTNSAAFFFTNSANTYFDFQIERVTFENCFQGIAEDSAATATVWGMAARDNTYGSTNSGSYLDLSHGSAGQPNIEVDGVYIVATNIVTSQPIITVANNDSGWFTHIEINGVTNGNTLMNLSGAGAIGTVKVEVATYGSGQFAFVFPNAHFSIASLSMDTLTVAATGGAAYGIDANGGGASTTLDIGQVNLSFNSIAGQFYLLNGGVAPAYSVRFRSNPQGLLGTANAFLTQVPAAVGSDGVSVDDWQQERLSADVGNTNATWSIGQPTITMFNTPLTANRTLTFTDANGSANDSNLYNGVKACVLRTTAATGAFTITVKTPGGTTLGTIASGAFGKQCFMWQRALGNWTLVDKETF